MTVAELIRLLRRYEQNSDVMAGKYSAEFKIVKVRAEQFPIYDRLGFIVDENEVVVLEIQ